MSTYAAAKNEEDGEVEKMKIGVLTFVHTSSFGAVLQAYALSHYIEECGAECELIDYRCEKVDRIHNPKRRLKVKSIRELAILPFIYPVFRKRMIKFLCFEKKYMKFSEKTYTRENIDAAAKNYDLIVAGSDQILNRNLTGNDSTYFLDFVQDPRKKCTYAASIGTEYFSDSQAKQCEEYLKDFRNLSVREERTALRLSENLGREVSFDVDPTLLYDGSFWRHFVGERPEKEDYIVIFMVPDNPALFQAIYRLAEKTQCKLMWIKPGFMGKKKVKLLNTLSPEEFLTYIYHAKYVITGSFHAVCFSVQFQKNLIAVLPEVKERVARVVSLLENVGLMDCLVKDFDEMDGRKTDYSHVAEKLDVLREKSRRTVQSISGRNSV